MTSVYTFPILKSLDVAPETAYEILFEGVANLRVMYGITKATGNREATLELYDKIQQGERLLHFMRLNSAACKIPDYFKQL